MTEIAFHFNAPDKLAYACRLLRKAVASGAKVVVTGAPASLQSLDTLLWTFSPHEFVAHCRAGSPAEQLMASPVVLAAKMLGTAAVARLFALTHPALMRLRWFANLYGRWKPWKDALIAHMKATAGWRAVQAWVHRLRAFLRALRDWFRH